MKIKTFKQWSAQGHWIKKGSKAVGFHPKTGEALFSDEQIATPKKISNRGSSWDDADDLNTCGGPQYGLWGNLD